MGTLGAHVVVIQRLQVKYFILLIVICIKWESTLFRFVFLFRGLQTAQGQGVCLATKTGTHPTKYARGYK